MNSEKKCIIIEWAIILISTCVALSITFGGVHMGTNGDTSIVVAIIGLIGAIVVGIIQAVISTKSAKRQGDEISKSVNEVKNDTTHLRPKTDTIDKNTEETNRMVARELLPNVEKVNSIYDIVDKINKEVEYQQRIKNDLSISASGKDYFISGIDNLYKENASLNNELKQTRQEFHLAQEQKIRQENTIKYQINRIKELEEENKKLKHENELLQCSLGLKYPNKVMHFEEKENDMER